MRPIDADALFDPNESTDKVLVLGRNGGKTIALAEKMMRERVNMAPTLTLDDLRPKGRWDLDEKRRRYCTNCKKVAIQFENKAYYVPDFCYHCGADMRGGGEDG